MPLNQFLHCAKYIQSVENFLFLTVADISAESGVPTFRGFGGLSRNFLAVELATPEAFPKDPLLVWNVLIGVDRCCII